MKRSITSLFDYTIITKDGLEGKIKDYLFDEESWIIRYLEVDFGNIFNQKRVLIPRIFLKVPEWDDNKFPIDIKKEELSKTPDINKRVPVSREYEKKLSDYYKLPYYWPLGYTNPPEIVLYPPRPLNPPAAKKDNKEIDSHLRSFEEIKGYHIKAIDGKIGHIEDMVVDSDDWQIVYLVIDTSNWLPWSKKVLVTIDWLENIDYLEREASISLHKDTIKNAPEYDLSLPLIPELEKSVYDFYSKSITK